MDDISTIIGIVSGIVSILSTVYAQLVSKDPVSKVLPNILKNHRARLTARVLSAIGAIVVFLVIAVPKSRVIEWVSASNPTFPNVVNREEASQQPLILRYKPELGVFAQTTLLSSDVYPTALEIETSREKKVFYVGSYGEGIFTSDNLPNWENIGLENMAITQIVSAGFPRTLFAATNLGVYTWTDGDPNWKYKGPHKDLVTTVAISPVQNSTILAGTLSGLYRSTDGGNTWLRPRTFPEGIVTSIVFAPVSPRSVYISSMPGTVHRSDDGGETWTRIRHADEKGSAPIAVDPRSPDVLYIGPSDLGLYRTSDAGTSWQYLGLKGVSISSIVVSTEVQDRIFVGTDSGHGIFTSYDGGKTWQNYGPLRDNIVAMAEDVNNPGSIIATTKRNGLINSSDFGRTWRIMGLHPPITTLSVAIKDLVVIDEPNHLLAVPVLQSGLLESTDGGNTWFQPVGLAEFTQVQFERININGRDPSHIILSGGHGMLLQSTDRGKTWMSISGNLPREGYAPVAFAKDRTIYAGPGNRGIWKKPPNEQEWSPLNLGSFSIEHIWVDADGIIISAIDENGTLHYSKDSGNTWATTRYKFQSVAADPNNIALLIGVSEDQNVLRSNDSGESWEIVASIPASAGVFRPSITASPEQPTAFYLTSENVLKTSFDGGDSWQEFTLPSTGLLHVSTKGILYFSDILDTMYTSSNFGENWTAIQNNNLSTSLMQVIRLGMDRQLASTAAHGLFISDDSGVNWTQTSIGSNTSVLKLAAVNHGNTRVATALIQDQSGINLVESLDGKVWQTTPLPCDEAGTYLGHVVNHDNNETWQIKCNNPSALIAINTSSLEWHRINLPETFTVTDARVESGELAYVLTQLEGSQRVHITYDGGNDWLETEGLSPEVSWALSDDLRSAAVLVAYQGSSILASLQPITTVIRSTYLACFLYFLIVFLFVKRRKVAYSVQKDFERVLRWTFHSNQSDIQNDLHPAFLWIGYATILITSVVLIQSSPMDSVTVTMLDQAASRHIIISLLARRFLFLPVTLTTTIGYIFLATLTVSVLVTGLLVTLMSAAGDIVARIRSGEPGSTRVAATKNAIAVLLLGTLLFSLLGVLPVPRTEGEHVLLGFGLSGIINLFQLFLFYQIIALALNTIAHRKGISRIWLALTYLGLVNFVIILARLAIERFIFHLPIIFQGVASNIPLTIFGFANTLIIIVYIWLNQSHHPTNAVRRKQVLSTGHRRSIRLPTQH